MDGLPAPVISTSFRMTFPYNLFFFADLLNPCFFTGDILSWIVVYIFFSRVSSKKKEDPLEHAGYCIDQIVGLVPGCSKPDVERTIFFSRSRTLLNVFLLLYILLEKKKQQHWGTIFCSVIF